jgi:hypothetical protein
MNQHVLDIYVSCLNESRDDGSIAVPIWHGAREKLLRALMPQPEPKPAETLKEMTKRIRSWSHKLAHKVGVHFCEACGGAFPDDKTMKEHSCKEED